MGGSTSKKVVIQRFDRESIRGVVNPASYLRAEGVEVLTQSGSLMTLPYGEVKAVCFVRDYEATPGAPEKRLFHARPKMEGLWVRMRFQDGELMDGLLANSLLEIQPFGFTVVPPNPSSNNQRIFVPRAALRDFHVLAVIGSPLRPRRTTAKAAPETQMEMFE